MLVALSLVGSSNALAGNLTRGGISTTPSGAGASTSQTATAATTITAQTSQATATANLAQISMQRSLQSFQALQAQLAMQNGARNLAIGSAANNLGTVTQSLPTVLDGLAGGSGGASGLVPGIAGTDPSDPRTIATTVPVAVGAAGTASVTLAANSAITLPPSVTGNSQITVSGTGMVGSITTGGTITALTAGVPTTVAPGSTISLTKSGTVTFAGGSSAIPSNLSTYTYTVPITAGNLTGAAPVPGSWSGIGGLTQSFYTTSGQTTVTITQTAPEAFLTWQTFNVGKNTTLDFDQGQGGGSVGQWVAINKVASGIAPSQILGAIQAPGQVYVINQNGVIFGGSSEVNAGALVVASLPINDNLAGYYNPTTGAFVQGRGLLNNPDLQFLFSQDDLAAGTVGPTPAFIPAAAPTTGLIATQDANGNAQVGAASGTDGDVIVEAGAQLTSPTTAEHVGGKIALVGTNVSNAGTISTPDGQTILAAGQQVGFEAHPSSTTDAADPAYPTPGPSLRGLDTYVGDVGSGGVASNTGTIDSERADITLVGKTVNQLGVIESTTSVALNGRIDLLADYNAVPIIPISASISPSFYPKTTGTVNLGAGSLTDILPETSSTDTVVGSALPLQSEVNIQGATIDLAAGSTLWAPSAAVAINAGTWVQSSPGYVFVNTSGQITLDPQAIIDVAGSQDVSASVTEDIVTGQLLGTQLANSPVQQNGPLRGATVEINMHDLVNYDGQTYVGTALADLSGYVNLVQHNVGELTTNGGTVKLSAGGAIDLQTGSQINVSGGWINYQGAEVQTTQLITSTGQIVDISKALPNVLYSGIDHGTTVSSTKWGTTETFTNSTQDGTSYEAGYIQGGNGGSVSITAPAITVAGSLNGNTVSGTLQTSLSTITTNAGVESWMTIPTASALSLAFQGTTANFLTFSSAPPDIVFQQGSGPSVADPFAGSGNPVVDLSSDLVNEDGFGDLTIINNNAHYVSGNSGAVTGVGNIAVPVGVSLDAQPQPGSSITFTAANIEIDGEVSAPAGSLSFTAQDTSPLQVARLTSTPAVDPTRGQFTLGSQAILDASGLLVDNRATSPTANTLPLAIAGGSVTIKGFNVDLATGSKINVSGGASVSAGLSVSYGNGGSVTIDGGEDPVVTSVQGGQLILDSELDGFSGAQGGSLSVLAPLIQIGGNMLSNGDTTSSGRTLWINETDGNGNLLAPDFFDQGGFDTFAFTGVGAPVLGASNPLPGVWIASQAKIAPDPESLLIVEGANGLSLTTTVLPLADQAPVSLSFAVTGITNPYPTPKLVVRGDLVMDAGASIELNPNSKGKVSFTGSTVTMLGQVTVPGGAITVSGGSTTANIFFNTIDVLPTADLGPQSVLSTAGATLLTPNDLGDRTGSVLNGGSITISGNIVAEQGSVLNVSGASDVLDVTATSTSALLNASRSQTSVVPTVEDSNGGTITLNGSEELYVGSTLLGYAGSLGLLGGVTSAQGGSLNISSGIFLSPNVDLASLSLVDQAIAQTGLIVVTPDVTFYPRTGLAVIGSNVSASAPLPDTTGFIGYGHFAASSFDQSGLASLTLNGSVLFSGTTSNPVTLTASGTLEIARGGIILADDQGRNSGVPIQLTAPYITLGESFVGPLAANQVGGVFNSGQQFLFFQPTWGPSTLSVTAGDLVDVGNLSLQNIGKLNVNVGTSTTPGDIRGDGTLDVAGQINFTAGSVYPTTEADFNIFAYDYSDTNGPELGSVTIASTGVTSQTPLSAGGEINIFGSTITQDGVLRAPIGGINLGWDGSGTSPVDFLSGAGTGGVGTPATVDSTQSLTLGANSLTSVSAIDSKLGDLTIPYGNVANGISWIDPSGTNITAGGVPAKAISISALNVSDAANSSIDIAGGGNLYAYNWVTGTGGTVDILNSTTSFAILPGYNTPFAPYYSTNTTSDFVNTKLAVGEQIYLNASNGLPAGTYTLLPAGYALLPGAYLVTPQSGSITNNSSVNTDGSSTVSGYMFNGLDSAAMTQPLLASFDVASESIVHSRAEYDNFNANSFLAQSAAAANAAVPRLPVDSGQVVFLATDTLNIDGNLTSQPGTGGLGGLVDIASPIEIDLVPGAVTPTPGVLTLDAATLQNFSAASLLIGGFRTAAGDATDVTVTTNDLNVESGVKLTGSDIILVSNGSLTINSGADIELSSSAVGTAQPLVFGNVSQVGSGDGVLVLVSSDPSAQVTRLGVDTQSDQDALASPPSLTIDANAQIGGFVNSQGTMTAAGSVTLDSTNQTSIDPTAILAGQATNLNSGQISLELKNQGPLVVGSNGQTTSGLVLSASALQNLQATAQSLSLLSYSSIDIYGSGTIGGAAVSGNFPVASLSLHAAEIRGFSDSGGGGSVIINAQNLSLDNSPNGTGVGAVASSNGSLTINAATINLGANQMSIDQYSNVIMNASGGIILDPETKVVQADTTVVDGTGALIASDNLTLNTPLTTAAAFSSTQAPGNETISATSGALVITSTGSPSSAVSEGLGATLTLMGASVTDGGNIALPSGSLTLEATAGDLTVSSGGVLNVGGTAKTFNDLLQYTNAGQVTLTSDTGSVVLASGSTVNVAAQSAAGNAGSLTVTTSSSAKGTFTDDGALDGQGGTGGQNGSFTLDVGSLSDLSSIDPALETGGFTLLRSIRVRTGDVAIDDTSTAQTFNLSTDQGSISVTGTGNINASGATGGTIDLAAAGSLTLEDGSVLTVKGQNFSNAGKGGSVTLEAGDYTTATANLWQTSAGSGGTEIYTGNAMITMAPTATIDLSVASVDDIVNPTTRAAALAAAAAAGDVTGTLHLRAPQIAGGDGIAITSVGGQISNASNVIIEGFSVQDANTVGTASIDSLEGNAETNASAFMNNNAATIQSNILTENPTLAAVINIEPGEEIDNTQGSLVLNNDWDLSTLRYGASDALAVTVPSSFADGIYGDGGAQLSAKIEPGILTIRAAGNVIFDGSLTDGFGDSLANDTPFDPNTGVAAPWENTLLQPFANGVGQQSWSYRLTAGADFSAANFQAVVPLSSLAANTGSIEVGNFALTISGQTVINPGQQSFLADAIVNPNTGVSLYQVIRTGTGDITVSAGRNVDLDNQFATIYTAGTQASAINNFVTPVLLDENDNVLYPAQYSENGGNVSISAQNDIQHLTEDSNGDIFADTERELPNKWLYRQGYVGSNGSFGQTVNGNTASTSWWIDFSNFFEGVGALGGGNVTLVAGQNVANVDAVVPTNARMTDETTLPDNTVSTLASDQTLVELGGGNLSVQAGNDINAGVYYVEHGDGVLDAGAQILTNATRAPSVSTLGISGVTTESSFDWLPTTLFLGGQQTDGDGSSFTVSSGGDLLLGSTANPFLLPSGIGNSVWDKTYFSTYDNTSSVDVSSLTGSVTIREDASQTSNGATQPTSLLGQWYADILFLPVSSAPTAASYQPWLALDEDGLAQFGAVIALLPPTLNLTSFSNDINVVGTLNLTPAPDGTVNLLAANSINAFQPVGTLINNQTGLTEDIWASSEINLSDADPTAIPGVNDPYALQSQSDVGDNASSLSTSALLNLSQITALFAVSGSTTGKYGVLETQEALHSKGILHLKDTSPIYLEADTGDISGLNLFSAKSAQIIAGQDITDIAFYLQNDNSTDLSVIEAGRDIIAYDLTSALRQQVNLTTSVYAGYTAGTLTLGDGFGLPNNGDIQIAGPGTLEVLAGRNLDLGVDPGTSSVKGPTNADNVDGTGVGLTSIGNTANPFLPFQGANIVAAAGVGAPGFESSQMNFGNVSYIGGNVTINNPATFANSFDALFLQPGTDESAIYLPELGAAMGLPASDSSQQIWTAFSQLSTARQDAFALGVFYLVLRDSGRDHNGGGQFAGTYTEGELAIKSLFAYEAPAKTWPFTGNISLTSREIKTTNIGSISLLAPGGDINVGLNLTSTAAQDQGILTTDGGSINIFANSSVNVGTSRIFTLHGGDEVIWSTVGNIDAGSASKTVQSAPPTRVLIDPQSADVETDLAGLATGGGIGVLETLAGVPPADVDLIAPTGTVDAGDAGIRASGNLNIAAARVLNAGNISVGGKSSGVPTTAAPNIAGLSAASSAAGASNSTAQDAARQASSGAGEQPPLDLPSIITVEVLGYGGDDSGA